MNCKNLFVTSVFPVVKKTKNFNWYLPCKFENKDNEDYVRAKKQYNIMEYENEDTLMNKSFDIKGDSTFDINKFKI